MTIRVVPGPVVRLPDADPEEDYGTETTLRMARYILLREQALQNRLKWSYWVFCGSISAGTVAVWTNEFLRGGQFTEAHPAILATLIASVVGTFGSMFAGSYLQYELNGLPHRQT